MHFAKLVLISSSFVVAALAQSKIAFTTLPSSVQAGVPTTLRWAGGDDSQPVTLTLQQGPPDNLQTVAIITGKATGNSYIWTPSKSLPNADDYALKISQGVDDTNYTGQFSLSGGSAAVATTSSSSSSLAAVTSAATLSSAIASLNNTVSSLVASISNATTTATTVAILTGTGPVASGGSSAATGTVLHRNTTMSHATLTSTKTTSTSTGGSSATGGASTAAGTSSAPSSSPSSDAMRMASPLAFVLSAFVAIVYLG